MVRTTPNGMPVFLQNVSLYFSDDPAAWAVLMASCHAENTVVCLSNTQLKRTDLEMTLVATVSAKSKLQ